MMIGVIGPKRIPLRCRPASAQRLPMLVALPEAARLRSWMVRAGAQRDIQRQELRHDGMEGIRGFNHRAASTDVGGRGAVRRCVRILVVGEGAGWDRQAVRLAGGIAWYIHCRAARRDARVMVERGATRRR